MLTRNVFLALGTLALTSVGAMAADLPMKAPPMMAPPPVAAFSWTGCYIGGQAGGGWARTGYTNTVDTTLFGDLVPGEGFSQHTSGFIGGGQLGCNYQINQFVLGIEGTFAGSTMKGSLNSNLGAADDVFDVKIDSIGTVVGRLGFAMNNWLFYAKGGYAGADVHLSVNDNVGPFVGSGSDSKWLSGWTVGGGIEYGITQNWIIGVEYNYIDLGKSSYEIGGGAGSYKFDVNTKINEVLARVSYKF